VENSFVDFVAAQLDGCEGLSCLAMFGGHGLYHGRTLVGIVSQGRFYLKADTATAAACEGRGVNPFRRDHEALRTFFQVPEDVLHDRARLAQRVRAALRSGAGSLPPAAPPAAYRLHPIHLPFV
jgi:DNA transformation protein